MIAQMKFAQSDIGFTKDAIVMIPVGSRDEKMKTLKNEMLQFSGITNISICFASPASVQSNWGTTVYYDNHSEPEAFSIEFKGADEDYLSTFDIDLVAGRNISPSDTIREFLVNETFIKKINLFSPR